ncbi:extracellular solute-binding protein [Ruania alba]|uniref:Carbohydrate ABC transporter substrate-binding protein, CUT1 family n=1 Tax=Ruania alba TaxID=648782 RepID=A0A1H5L5J1_9MICO|nr:extracellular solute-binding protein [Ruania alba]SEE71488.1 carbohydrate ABC transporter substrate-binding protein, CUT1 family [Ruania alba]
MTLTLRGITWDHPRGFDSIVAASRTYASEHDVEIVWEKRSLQAFADQGLESLTAQFDLLVIDHPHIAHAAHEGLLAPLPDGEGPAAYVGRSYESYRWQGAQYGLAIDAAAQVAAYRPDLLPEPPRTWADVLDLARDAVVLWPYKPIDAFASTFTLTSGVQGYDGGRGRFGDPDAFAQAWDVLGRLRDLVPAECSAENPIETSERLATGDRWCYAPLLYGYVTYARPGFRPHRLAWTDIPAIEGEPRGSMLGGAGLSVSAHGVHRDEALAFACWAGTGAVQRGVYAEAGGQPGHVDAWEDVALAERTGDFFGGTRRTLELASLRPPHPGYMDVQNAACARVHRGLMEREGAAAVLEDLDPMFATLGVTHADR